MVERAERQNAEPPVSSDESRSDGIDRPVAAARDHSLAILTDGALGHLDYLLSASCQSDARIDPAPGKKLCETRAYTLLIIRARSCIDNDCRMRGHSTCLEQMTSVI